MPATLTAATAYDIASEYTVRTATAKRRLGRRVVVGVTGPWGAAHVVPVGSDTAVCGETTVGLSRFRLADVDLSDVELCTACGSALPGVRP